MRAEFEIPDRLGAVALDSALEGLVALGMDELLQPAVNGAQWPTLYTSGVRYEREHGAERWYPPSEVLANGVGDCEDLASWRTAELRVTGEDPSARAQVIRSGPRTWHAVVSRENGTYIEDPSAILGMGTEEEGSLAGWDFQCNRGPGGYTCTLMRDGTGVVGRARLASDAIARACGAGEVGQIPGLDILARAARGALQAALPSGEGPTPPMPAIPGLSTSTAAPEIARIARQISAITTREARRKLTAAQRAVRGR